MQQIKLLFGIEGRIGRGQFWYAVAIWLVFYLAVILISMVLTTSLDTILRVAAVTAIPIVVSSIAVGIKRLHDRNKNPWWLLLFYGGPYFTTLLGILFGGTDDQGMDATPFAVVALQYISAGIVIWSLGELGFLRGTIGTNPFGPDPVAPKPAKH
jgi:uncharacterized membrane protein YhaH (DUF805 family)